MKPIITELDPETGEWEIVTTPDNQESIMDTLVGVINKQLGNESDESSAGYVR